MEIFKVFLSKLEDAGSFMRSMGETTAQLVIQKDHRGKNIYISLKSSKPGLKKTVKGPELKWISPWSNVGPKTL